MKQFLHHFLGLFLMLLSLATPGIHGYEDGAPPTACEDMRPGHYGAQYHTPADGSEPYEIVVNSTHFGPDDPVEVTIRTKPGRAKTFKGFMLQAREATNRTLRLPGTFTIHHALNTPANISDSIKLLACADVNDSAVTHKKRLGIDSVAVVWNGHLGDHSDTTNATFIATVVEVQSSVWMGVLSPELVFRPGGSGCGRLRVPSFQLLCSLLLLVVAVILPTGL